MKPGLGVGAKAALHGTVGGEDVIHLGAGGPAGAIVFCTPSMINLMEYAGREVLRPFLEPNEESVGVNVTVEHLAATPVGLRSAVRTPSPMDLATAASTARASASSPRE